MRMCMYEHKKELLSKAAWTYKDIMSYFPEIKSKATAIKIKNRAIKEQNGAVKYGIVYVKADSVLALYGTSRMQELKIMNELVGNHNEEELR